jgi:hypothetical protein
VCGSGGKDEGQRDGETGRTSEGEGGGLDTQASQTEALHTLCLLTWPKGLVTGVDVGTGGGQKGSPKGSES